MRERLERLKIRPYGMRWRHFDGFRAAGVPYATDTLGMRTPLDTQTLARCFPWLAQPDQHAHRARLGALRGGQGPGALRPLGGHAGRRPARARRRRTW